MRLLLKSFADGEKIAASLASLLERSFAPSSLSQRRAAQKPSEAAASPVAHRSAMESLNSTS